MIKNLGGRNQRSIESKVMLALRTCLVLAAGIWMIYQLRLFLSQKLSSENGASPHGEIQQTEQLNLGRKGLDLMDEEANNSDEMEQSGKGKLKSEMDEEEEIEDLTDGAGKGGDVDDEEMETERFVDPMEEIEPLNDDDEGDDENGDDANVQQQRNEDGDAWGRLNKDETDAAIRVAAR